MLTFKLKEFYKNRKNFINFENVDYTDVYDPYLEEKVSNPIMIVGEAPGANEVEQKSPFVGMAGKNLAYLINRSKYDRKKDILITNAFPFRTFKNNKNRTPSAKELKEGAKLLLQEIDIVRPRLILLLGNSAVKAFSYLPIEGAKDVRNFPRNSINKIDLFVYETKVGVSFHPSPISFNRKDIRKALESFFDNL